MSLFFTREAAQGQKTTNKPTKHCSRTRKKIERPEKRSVSDGEES